MSTFIFTTPAAFPVVQEPEVHESNEVVAPRPPPTSGSVQHVVVSSLAVSCALYCTQPTPQLALNRKASLAHDNSTVLSPPWQAVTSP